MKKTIICILALCLCLALAACAHEHQWVEASCTAPRTCSVCGATEGEPLPHTWVEANYQEPATCLVCGATEGEPLTPDFETYGIVPDMQVGETYVYETTCYNAPDVKTVGQLSVVDYTIIPSDDDHEAKDGYEWRIATFQILFSDDNAKQYGYQWSTNREDYYNIRLNDDSAVYDESGDTGTYLVNYHGEEMECRYELALLSNGWDENEVAVCTLQVSVQVPVGYDGCVYGLRDSALEWPEGGYIYDFYQPEGFHLFRFA